jgi:hypothetical protein
MIVRRGRHLGLGVLVAVGVLGTFGAGPTAARPWTADYQWQSDSRTGYENWVPEESVPGDGAAGPFYRTSLGSAPAAIGRGLAFEPLGGRVYGNGDPTKETGGPGSIVRWRPPGASTISSATFSQLRYRNEGDGQYLRIRVTGRTPEETDAATEDFGAKYGQGSPTMTYTLPNRTFDTPAGQSAEAWMFTICGGDPTAPGQFQCPMVASDTDTFSRIGGVRLTLEDPDDPVVDVATSPDIGAGYVNKRRTQRLTITAKDPSSGIARIRVQVANGTGGGGRTLVDRRITCDEDHRTAGRGGLVCPETATATATDPASAQGKTARTYTVSTTDFAGNVTTNTRTLRLDTTAPDAGSLSGELKRLLDGWTNRRGTVPVTVRATDGLSGVGKVEVLAQRVASGRTAVLGSAETSCSDSCRTVAPSLQADLDQITQDGRYRLQVRVTDRAGNAKTFKVAAPLKVDRTAPKKVGKDPFYRVLGDGRIRVYVPAGRDAPDGAGLGNYIVRYFAKGDPVLAPMALLRFARVQADRARIVRYKKQRYRTLDVSNVDTSQPIEGPSTACDSARYGAPSAALGGEVGNCPRVVTLVRAASGTEQAVRYEYVEQGLQDLERFANTASAKAVPETALVLRLLRSRLARILVRGSIIAELYFFLRGDGDASCEDGANTPAGDLRRQAKATNGAVERALAASGKSTPGTRRAVKRQLDSAARRLGTLTSAAERARSGFIGRCQVSMAVAEGGVRQVAPQVKRAQDLEAARRADDRLRAQAKRKGVSYGRWKVRVQQSSCNRDPNTGGGDTVLYYVKNNSSPTPALNQGVIYVGKTKDANRRCRQHIRNVKRFPIGKYPRLHVFVYNLGRRLTGPEARAGEQVLIDAYGRLERRRNYNYDAKRISRVNGGVGELLNLIEAVPSGRGARTGYCAARKTGVAVFQRSARAENAFLWQQAPGFRRRNC